MSNRYFVCGSITDGDRIIPEVVPELPPRTREFRGRTVTGTLTSKEVSV